MSLDENLTKNHYEKEGIKNQEYFGQSHLTHCCSQKVSWKTALLCWRAMRLHPWWVRSLPCTVLLTPAPSILQPSHGWKHWGKGKQARWKRDLPEMSCPSGLLVTP